MPKYEGKSKIKPEGESKPNYYKGNMTRAQEQQDEGLVSTDNSTAPKSRYETNQQVSDVSNAAKVVTPKTGFNKQFTSAGGSAVKQEVASKVLLTDADYAGVAGGSVASGGRSGLKTLAYSGDAGTILGSAAQTPVVGTPSRSEGRFEKKLDAASKKIDFLASEQVLTEYSTPKPLGASGGDVQGYYGTPKNTNIRSQKSAGGTPASLLVERSADLITRDELVFVNGQYVKSDLGLGNTYGVEPTKSTVFTNGVRTEKDLAGNDAIIYGNYINRAMTVTITKPANSQAYVSAISFTSEDMTNTNGETDAVVNAASTNWLVDMNRDEVARQAIDSNAGRETEMNWSPLGRAVAEPTATVGLLSRLESDTGANVYTSYKVASKAHAYQLNKAAKDGQRIHTPMREMIIGDIAPMMSSEDFSSGTYYNGISSIFNKSAYKAGAASLMIALFDSPNKYSTKADVLLQPRSLRKAFQVADNNMDVFRLKKEFVAAINNRDVFSTIERGYDPLLPVCMTDKIGLISPISYARFGDFTRSAAGAAKVYTHTPFSYAYANRSSNYTINVGHPLLDGIADFFDNHASKLYDICYDKDVDKNNTVVINVPIRSSSCTFSLWDFIVMHAVPYIQKCRINSMRDVLDYEVNFSYPFELIDIKQANPKNAVNYNLVDIDTPLEVRQMIPSVAVTWVMPEFGWCVGTGGSSQWLTVLPWYFNEMQLKATVTDKAGDTEFATAYSQDYMSGVMSMPVIRNGIRLSTLDSLYSMDERDIRLCLDRMVRPFAGADKSTKYAVYKYGQANEGIPCIAAACTIKDYISTPRELGWFMVAPAGLLRVCDNLKANATKLGFAAFAATNSNVNGDTSYRLYCYKGVPHVDTEILGVADVNISRAQAFRQYWDCSPAVYMAGFGVDNNTYRARLDVGFLVSTRQVFAGTGVSNVSFGANQGVFVPFTIGGVAGSPNAKSYNAQTQSTSDELKVIALHKGLWGRLQRLPMVISPWDTCDFIAGSGANYDPYDFAYMFGFAGMMASDYNQDLYNRTNLVQEKGWLYTDDPFVTDSPVFKDAIKYTL